MMKSLGLIVRCCVWLTAALLLLSSSVVVGQSALTPAMTNNNTAVAATTTAAAQRLGVRFLLNLGQVDGTGCSVEEFALIKSAVANAVEQSNTFQSIQSNRDPRQRQLQAFPNCAELCCGYAYGTCGIYNRACVNFPTPTSNRECDRRELLRGSSAVATTDRNTTFVARHGKSVINGDVKLKKACRALEKEVSIAIGSILDLLDDSCADMALLPTLLECFLVDYN